MVMGKCQNQDLEAGLDGIQWPLNTGHEGIPSLWLQWACRYEHHLQAQTTANEANWPSGR